VIDGFTIVGAIDGLRGEPLLWLAGMTRQCIHLLGAIEVKGQGGRSERIVSISLVADFDGFTILGAIDELRGEPLVGTVGSY
jgi:hypothetical protein